MLDAGCWLLEGLGAFVARGAFGDTSRNLLLGFDLWRALFERQKLKAGLHSRLGVVQEVAKPQAAGIASSRRVVVLVARVANDRASLRQGESVARRTCVAQLVFGDTMRKLLDVDAGFWMLAGFGPLCRLRSFWRHNPEFVVGIRLMACIV